MPIQILPEHIANQIAAGEVVEGPSSIVKELVENSIDAKATKIDIEISKQLLKIQVLDNGTGMSSEDLSLAFKRHATSKIKSIEDLHKLTTMGFRGEALASIASVSKLTCISKRAEDKHASRFYTENGNEEITITGASNGTSITVDDLFFNTPARLKFLKSNTKERGFIIDTVRSLAIANPKVAFSLIIDGKSTLKSSGSGNLEKCLQEIFSDELSDGLIKVDFTREGININGYISKPHLTRSDKRGIFTIVNGRILKCFIIKSAVEAVYKEILPAGKYPIAVISLTLAQEDIDVNVHPNKKEVKYSQTNKIYSSIGDAVAKALADHRYQSSQSFQPSIQDYVLSQSKIELNSKLNQDLINNSDHYSSLKQKTYGSAINIAKTSQEEAAMEFLSENFQELEPRKNYKDDFSFELPESRLSSPSRKFISRLGSVDISLTNNKGLKTIISELGNKTTFELIINKADSDEQSAIIRGDFIGENWLKEKYLGFLAKLGEEILERENLEVNFCKTGTKDSKSRPASKPSSAQLEEIWKRDHYTCVYCSKLLLHPNLVKSCLSKCSKPDELNSHLASYDHHLPASKFPELNQDSRNLYACCIACNQKKSDSLASQTWSPNVINGWEGNKLTIANLVFTEPK